MILSTRLLLLASLALLLVQAPRPAVASQGGQQGPAAPTSEDIWSEPGRVERGAKMFDAILAAHGGLEAWGELQGVRFDMLESWRVLTKREPLERKIHHRTAQLCWFQPGGDGFVKAEYVKPDGFTPAYRREVLQGKYAWAEADEAFLRQPQMAARARAFVQSRHFYATFPFSLHERGAELVFLKRLPTPVGVEGARDRSLYGARLAEPVVLGKEEEVREFVLVVDNETSQVLQVQYSYFGEDRITLDKSTECYVDYAYGHTVGDVLLHSSFTWFFETDLMAKEFWVEDVRDEAVPPAALRRPWQAGGLWETDQRADFWDPPVAEGAEEAGEGAEDGAPGDDQG